MRLAFLISVCAATLPPTEVASWFDERVARNLKRSVKKSRIASKMEQRKLVDLGEPIGPQDVLNPIMRTMVPVSGSMYRGIGEIVFAGSDLAAAWTTVARSPETDCVEQIERFWVNRGHWFVMSGDDMVFLSACIETALEALSSWNNEPSPPVADGTLVASVLVELMRGVYAPYSFGWLKTNTPLIPDAEEKFAAFKPFQQFVRESPNLLTMLREEAELVTNPPFLDSADAPFGAHLLEGGDHFDFAHSGDFIDMILGRTLQRAKAQLTLPFWRALVDRVVDFDEKEFRFETKKKTPPAQRFDMRFHHYHVGMGMARGGWRNGVGALVMTLLASQSREEVIKCLPSDVDLEDRYALFNALESNLFALVIPTYRCIVDGVSKGTIELPAEGRGYFVAVLMHMARMSHGALAFLLQNQ